MHNHSFRREELGGDVGKRNVGKEQGPGQGPRVPRNAVNAIPGNSSGWHFGESPAWLKVDPQEVYPIDRIKVFPYCDGGRYYQRQNGTVPPRCSESR